MELRDYQKNLASQAYQRLVSFGMAYLAMEVRTGKTLTALHAAFLYGAKNVLFLTKKKAIASIEKDYKNFSYTFGLHVTNYEQLGKFIFNFDLVICDEAHGFGAYPKQNKRALILKSLINKIPVIYLSGTPTPEGYSQIFNQLAISYNSPYRLYRNFYTWAKSGYVNITTVKRGVYLLNDYSDANQKLIKKDIEHIMLTYTQNESGFNCEVKEYFHEVEDERVASYIKHIFRHRIILFDKGNCVADTPAKLMGKMHQISSGSAICENGTEIISYNKIKYIKETFKSKRIGIYYKFQAEKIIVMSEFPEATEIPEDFQSGKSDTFISQILSGREGITLYNADAIVFFNIDYSATSYFQARARLQDLKRETPAEVHWIFTRGGIEKKVYQAVSNKKDFTYSYFMRNGAI